MGILDFYPHPEAVRHLSPLLAQGGISWGSAGSLTSHLRGAVTKCSHHCMVPEWETWTFTPTWQPQTVLCLGRTDETTNLCPKSQNHNTWNIQENIKFSHYIKNKGNLNLNVIDTGQYWDDREVGIVWIKLRHIRSVSSRKLFRLWKTLSFNFGS